MNDNLKYQTGQQFLIRVETDNLPFRVRVKGYSEKADMYCIQRIGHSDTVFMTETQLDRYIHMVDNH